MKKLVLTLTILSLVACGESDEEKQKRQIDHIVAQQPNQTPVIIQQPVVVQQHDNTMTNMLGGVLLGHAIANSSINSNIAHGPSYDRDYGASSRTVTKNITINQPAPVTSTPVAPKVNSMDTNKFNTYNPISPTSKPNSSMNMNKLSSSGKR